MNYRLAADQAESILQEEPFYVSAMSNISALLKDLLPDLNWAGFYLMRDGRLTVGPFQGKPAVSRIAYGKGVCGTAWKEDKSQVVEEVSCFPGHIACDCSSRSEIVIPLRKADGSIWGVLDMDSVLFGYFTEEDREGLEEVVKQLVRVSEE